MWSAAQGKRGRSVYFRKFRPTSPRAHCSMFRLHAFIASVLLCLAAGQALGASNSDAAAFAAAVEKARAEQLDVLAPKAFAAAVQASQAATREAERGRSPDKVAARVQEGQAALQRARSVADGA